eukprot:TRINITY_DN4066_c0_g1_i2.p1 TRINITY_DN4066_c0_g1~~TRINITY_DN4066_c0_g1_i2.p1  ORF type:complete len:569 (+),score=102.56 TRINITY_DN4066_c0_g1_i2:125-1831(+)
MEKARKSKHILENYYRDLEKNTLANTFVFDASRKKQGKLKKIEINLVELSVRYGKHNQKPKIIIPFKEILQCVKPKLKNRKLFIVGPLVLNVQKTHKFYFPTMELRERFCEIMYFGLQGITPIPEQPPEYTQQVRVFIGTWNMGDAPPPPSLHDWIPPGQHDIYAIGVQECNYQPRSGYSSCDEDWFSTVLHHLGDDYAKIASMHLLKIKVCLFARREHLHKIHSVQKSYEATGIGHVYGNKGGVAISLEFYETSMCFVAAHFAAHQEKLEDRNSNYYEIIEGIRIGKKKNADILHQFNHIFWCGDLNYRIDMFREEVLSLIAHKNFPKLLRADQLLKEREKQTVFSGWHEGPLNFSPTYKYDRGNRVYAEEKNRTPSWCDRILWKSLPGSLPVTQTQYNAADQLTTSDHSPVYATFTVPVLQPIYAHFTHIMSPPHEPCRIALYELRGYNLVPHKDSGKGTCDPYLEVAANYLEETVSTAVINRNCNPAWGGAVIIKPCIGTYSFLLHQHLQFRLFDHDANEEMGQCVLALKDGFGEEPSPFVMTVTKFGRRRGEISGKVHVLYYKR